MIEMYAQRTVKSGDTFNDLTVISESERVIRKGISYRTLLCQCKCGKTKVVLLCRLVRGGVKSCGCLAGEKHNLRHTRLYRVWKAMNERCHGSNVNNKHFRNYQQRGISVCEEWRKSFKSFYDWANYSGYAQGLQIDRIDNDKGYCPENCRFVTPIINANNRRLTIKTNVDGVLMSVTEMMIKMGVDLKYQIPISKRIKRGWPYQEAILPPFTRSRPKRTTIVKEESKLVSVN